MRSFIEYMVESPSTVDLPSLYRQLNIALFGGALPNVPISFGTVRKGASGMTTMSIVRKSGMPGFMKYHGATTDLSSIRVVIQKKAWPNIDVLKGIVAHEMCHVACFVNNQLEVEGHGPFFHQWRLKAQQNAPFEIPLSDTSDVDEYENPKPVMFVVAKGRSGKIVIWLFRPTMANETQPVMAARIFIEHLVKKSGSSWAAVGLAKTNLANTMPVARKFKPSSDAYVLAEPKKLGIQQIFHTEGPFPAHEFA